MVKEARPWLNLLRAVATRAAGRSSRGQSTIVARCVEAGAGPPVEERASRRGPFGVGGKASRCGAEPSGLGKEMKSER